MAAILFVQPSIFTFLYASSKLSYGLACVKARSNLMPILALRVHASWAFTRLNRFDAGAGCQLALGVARP